MHLTEAMQETGVAVLRAEHTTYGAYYWENGIQFCHDVRRKTYEKSCRELGELIASGLLFADEWKPLKTHPVLLGTRR